jgi:hypothetical protein
MMSATENKNTQEFEIQSHIYPRNEDLSKLCASIRVDLARLETKIEKSKCEIIQWMFILYMVQISIFFLILIFFRK